MYFLFLFWQMFTPVKRGAEFSVTFPLNISPFVLSLPTNNQPVVSKGWLAVCGGFSYFSPLIFLTPDSCIYFLIMEPHYPNLYTYRTNFTSSPCSLPLLLCSTIFFHFSLLFCFFSYIFSMLLCINSFFI